MEDINKTKAELVADLERMRRRVETLETQLAEIEPPADDGVRAVDRSQRKELRTHVEFIADFDVIEAKAINISEGGICFAMDEDLPFEMRFELDGKIHQHRAHLVWVKRESRHGYQFGLMFVHPRSRDLV